MTVTTQLVLFFTVSTALTVVGILMLDEEEKAGPNEARTVPDLIRSYGYPVEEHTVISADGYILTLHRIPSGKNDAPGNSPKVPVFLGHCLVGSSSVFSFGPPEKSLAYMLADAGYDVWMPNIRGNRYSRYHVSLPSCPTCSEFWSFGLEEPAVDDYPTAIDYILEQTEASDLHFAGFSMGTTMYLIMLAERPEYNSKIRSGHLLGPVAYAANSTHPVVALAEHGDFVKSFLEFLGINELLPGAMECKHALANVCPRFLTACRTMFAVIIGMDKEFIDESLMPVYMEHSAEGGNLGQFAHYAQLFSNGGRFAKYDHGRMGNLLRYGSAGPPPEYDLSKVTVPTALYVGAADRFATPQDADRLAEELPNILENHLVEDPRWGHLHFGYSRHQGGVNERVLSAMRRIDSEIQQVQLEIV